MSQMNVIVIHVRHEQAKEYKTLFEQEELPRWQEYRAAGKFLNARFYRSEFGTDKRADVQKYVIVVEVPSMAEHSAHDSDPGFQEFNQKADVLQPEDPLVFGAFSSTPSVRRELAPYTGKSVGRVGRWFEAISPPALIERCMTRQRAALAVSHPVVKCVKPPGRICLRRHIECALQCTDFVTGGLALAMLSPSLSSRASPKCGAFPTQRHVVVAIIGTMPRSDSLCTVHAFSTTVLYVHVLPR